MNLKEKIELIINNGRITNKKISYLKDEILNRTNYLKNASIQERCFNIIKDMYELPKCRCGKNITSFLRISVGYRDNCSVSCAVKNYKEDNPDIENKRIKKIQDSFNNKPYNEKLEKAKRVLKTRIKRGINLPKESKKDYEIYHREVWKLTNRLDINKLKNSEFRGRTSYHLDHKYSIKMGFENNILPHIIANINNLEFLYFKENCSKSSKSSITKKELFEDFDRDVNKLLVKSPTTIPKGSRV